MSELLKSMPDGTSRMKTDGLSMIILPGGNVYVETGPESNRATKKYLTEHLPSYQLRTNPDHWNELYSSALQAAQIEQSWTKANRPGLFEFIHNLAEARKEDLVIASLGAGPGSETASIARLPGVQKITGVDFSQEACKRASQRISDANLDNAEMVTQTNNAFLLSRAEESFDFIMIYGGLIENTADVAEIRTTLNLAQSRLKKDGVIWGVGLNQPALKGADYSQKVATDILGEFPHATGTFRGQLDALPQMTVAQALTGVKTENHPLTPGGDPIKHSHTVERLIAVKQLDADTIIPSAGFSAAISSEWQAKYAKMIEESDRELSATHHPGVDVLDQS